MKTFARKDVFSWSNCIGVKVGMMGYFAFNLKELKELVKKTKPKKLLEVVYERGLPFKACIYNGNFNDYYPSYEYYPFFLPVDKITSEKQQVLGIFDKKDIFTIVTAEEAKAYIGKQGYFGDSIQDLVREINEYGPDELAEVFPEHNLHEVFRPQYYESSYGLFLPAEKVK